MDSPDATEIAAPTGDGLQEIPFGEPRWPPVLALLVFMGLNIGLRLWLPQDRFSGVPWLLPGIELLLLVALLAADPGRVASRASRTRAHRVVILLVVLLVLGALFLTALLIYDLIIGAKVTQAPGPLLAAGALVWLGNNLAFGMLYWLMDSGGPIARSRAATPVDFAFTQQMSPELASRLHDATAFSPTDLMPLTLRAKYVMVVQSTVTLALFALVVVRAVNALT